MATFPIVKSDQRAVLGVAITFTILPVIAVALRILARRKANRSLDWSDYSIVLAAVFAVALESISITGVVQCGIGYDHVPNIVAEYGMGPITKLLKVIFAKRILKCTCLTIMLQLILPLQILWAFSLSACKVSVLLLCMKIFALPTMIWAARITIIIIAAWATTTVLLSLLICRPLAFNWNQAIPGGKCGNQVLSFTVTGIINLITDFIVLALPLPFLYNLQLPRYKKIVLLAVFSIGFLTCVISGFRIHTLKSMDFVDITYSIPLANIFSGLEPSIAIVLACVPLMRPLLGRKKYSLDGTAQYQASGNSRQTPSSLDKHNFQPLSDDSSQYQLRPMGLKYDTEVSAPERISNKTSSEGTEELGSDIHQDKDSDRGGIRVRQEWNISNEPSSIRGGRK
ncbi:Satratoxin biosynthesis SC16 cluster protein [Paramyrothecium foliicola]|nr:Satratoxin biosynthesis SC16 cluster protein [Paramyrothecium foliicola]